MLASYLTAVLALGDTLTLLASRPVRMGGGAGLGICSALVQSHGNTPAFQHCRPYSSLYFLAPKRRKQRENALVLFKVAGTPRGLRSVSGTRVELK